MHCGHVQKADDLTAKIGCLISDKRRSLLSKVDINCTEQLWDVVKASHGQIDVIFGKYYQILVMLTLLTNTLLIMLRTPRMTGLKLLNIYLMT